MVGATPLLSEAFRAEFAPLLDWTTNARLEHGRVVGALLTPLWSSTACRRSRSSRAWCARRAIPRPGALELLKRLELLNAARAHCLRGHGRRNRGVAPSRCTVENVTVCSNRLNYQADSTPKSVSPSPPIPSFTKERGTACLGLLRTAQEPPSHRSAWRFAYGRRPCQKRAVRSSALDRLSQRAAGGRKHVETFDAVVVGNEGSLQPVADLLDALPATTLAGKAIDAIRRSPSGRWLTSAASSPRSSPPRSPLSQ